ncbi:MAG: gamma-glutamyltransferase [Gemmatimonadota bacterium]
MSRLSSDPTSRGGTKARSARRAVRAAACCIRCWGPLLGMLLIASCRPSHAGRDGSRADSGEDMGRVRVRFPDAWPFSADQRPVKERHAMVVSTDSLASAAGLEVLRDGGNAVDAAIAVHFALAVTHPQAGNLGGGGFMIVRLSDGTRAALDFREKAPGLATRDMYLDAHGEVREASWTGPLAAGVPGSVAGMEAAHRRFGSLSWRRLLAPAIRYADGVPLSEDLRRSLVAQRDRLSRFPQTAAALLPGGEVPDAGSTYRQPDLARTLRAIAESGASAFYRGWIADSIAAQMERDGGIIRRQDLAAYEAVWREPVRISYEGREILSMPPPSSGGVTLAELLNVVSKFDLAEAGWHSARAIHLMVEAMRRAYADRNRYLGDPDFVPMPLARLMSRAHADSLRSTIDVSHASRSEDFGEVASEGVETTHFSIVDADGNAVAETTTLNGSFGSGVVVRGAGFLLNNEMDDFAAKPGSPNAYGLVQGEANAIRPGKRMLSSMTPTVVVGADGKVELVTGTPGGATIITSIFQILVNHMDYGLGVQTSVNAPRFHHQHLPDRVFFERGGLEPAVMAELRRLGHTLAERKRFSGDVESIYIGPDGTRYGAADPRGDGSALGY